MATSSAMGRLGSRWRVLRFLLALAGQSSGQRSLRGLLGSGLFEEEALEVQGLERVPAQGPFVLAVNHYAERHTMEVVAMVLRALRERRPGLYEELAVVVGRAQRPVEGWRATLRRWATGWQRWLLGRWEKHVLRLALEPGMEGVRTLRVWQRRAQEVPTLVFPEGRLGSALGPMRPGAGRLLAKFPVPTVPLALWRGAAGWVVRVGEPVAWTEDARLHDVQLGLALAALLPPELRGPWEPLYARWRSAWALPAER